MFTKRRELYVSTEQKILLFFFFWEINVKNFPISRVQILTFSTFPALSCLLKKKGSLKKKIETQNLTKNLTKSFLTSKKKNKTFFLQFLFNFCRRKVAVDKNLLKSKRKQEKQMEGEFKKPRKKRSDEEVDQNEDNFSFCPPSEDYEVKKVIGVGTFGVVW